MSHCSHSTTLTSRDGVVSCSACGKVLQGKDKAQCPICLGVVSVISVNDRSFCTKCQKYLPELVILRPCPMCRKTSAVTVRDSQTFWCSDCKCTYFKPTGKPTPVSSKGSRRRQRKQQQTVDQGRLFEPIRSSTTDYSSRSYSSYGEGTGYTYVSKATDGVCPVCGCKVTTYTKTGGWCKRCQKMVNAWNPQPHPFVNEEELV